MIDNIIEFLKHLRGSKGLELNNLNNKVSRKDATGGTNIYFVGGVKEGIKDRCSDNDIEAKNYFVVDIDMRLTNFQKKGKVLNDSELLWETGLVLEELEKNGLNDYSYVVHSGNGIHLYYCGTEREFDKQVYSDGVKYIYSEINNVIGSLGYECDPACHNIARITRLPGSINPRKKEILNKETKEKEIAYDLGPFTCEILIEQKQISGLFENIEEYAKKQSEEKDETKKDVELVRKIAKQYQPEDIRADINAIPIGPIAEEVWGVTLGNTSQDNVPLKESNKNMGAYWWKPTNVIVNTGSSMIKTNKNYFTTYELVLYEMFGGDKKRTIEYFKSNHGIDISGRKRESNEIIIPPKVEYAKYGFLYNHPLIDKNFDCLMSGELGVLVATSNSGKTSTSMDMMERNSDKGKKCFFINLEFPIETVWQSKWLFKNGKKKRNLTDIDPLTDEEKNDMDIYTKAMLKKFDYFNEPKGIELGDLVDLLLEKHYQGYQFFVVDTLSRIGGNMDSSKSHTSQNKTMAVLQELCQNTGMTVLLLHHTNKAGEFEGSQKIMDLANVFISMKREEDAYGDIITSFILKKDKYVSAKPVRTKRIDGSIRECDDDGNLL